MNKAHGIYVNINRVEVDVNDDVNVNVDVDVGFPLFNVSLIITFLLFILIFPWTNVSFQ